MLVSGDQVRKKLALSYLFLLLVLALLFRAIPWEQIDRGLLLGPQCPLKRWLGLQCSFCGMTHSWIALFKGEFGHAFQENVLGPFVLVGSIIVAGVVARDPLRFKMTPRLLGVLLAILAAYTVIRNLI